MTLFVRPATLPKERGRLTEILGRNLPDLDHDARFEWIYERNPAGRGRAWFVCAGQEGHVVGTASVFPKFIWIDRKVEVCAQVGNFAVDSSYRSLGPALMLQRATLTPVDEGYYLFVYDCPPHDRGMATFQRLGLSPVCRMARFVRLLRTDGAVRQVVPGAPFIRVPLAAAANVVLRGLDVVDGLARGIATEVHEGTFGDEFSSLDKVRAKTEAGVVRPRRHADDLNWKFRRHPLDVYRVVTARGDGSLLGFAVYRHRNDRARLVDISSTSSETHLALLRATAVAASREGALTIDLLAVRASREATLGRRARYLHRGEAERVVVYAAKAGRVQAAEWDFAASDVMA